MAHRPSDNASSNKLDTSARDKLDYKGQQ